MLCGLCFKALLGATTRRRFCGDACRSAAWRKRKEEAARREGRRAALAEIGAALEQAREALRQEGKGGPA